MVKRRPAKPPAIVLNGQLLHELAMRYTEESYPGSVASLHFPEPHYVLAPDDKGFTLVMPPVAALQLFVSGVLTPDADDVDLRVGDTEHSGLRLAWVRIRLRPGQREDVAMRFEPEPAAT